MKVLILLSGGCESTALLELAKQEGHDVICVHGSWSNATEEEKEFCVWAAEQYGYPIYHPRIENDEMSHLKTHIALDIAHWLPLSALISIQLQDIDVVWYGAHMKDDMNALGRIYFAFDILRQFTSGKPPKTMIDAPLHRLKKIQQYDMVPEHIRDKILFCQVKKDTPCGTCKKCEEWKREGMWKTEWD